MAGEFENITNALKIAYPKVVIDAMVNEETPARSKMKKSLPAGSRASDGIVKIPANFNPPQNSAFIKDGGTLPIPKDRTQDQFQITPIICAGAFQIGWITKSAASSDKGAFNGGELRRRTEETISNLAKNIEMHLLQNYDNATYGGGVRAIVESGNASTFVARQPEGVVGLRENMVIAVKDSSGAWDDLQGGATAKNYYISNIVPSTRTVTLAAYNGSGAVSNAADANDVIVQVSGDNSTFQTDFTALTGLRGLVDDATLQTSVMNLSRATYPKLNSVVNSNAGVPRALEEKLMIQACHDIRIKVGKRVTDCWTGPGQAEKYVEFVAPDRRYNVSSNNSPMPMVTGYDVLKHVHPSGSFEINISTDVIPREMFLLNWDSFFHYVSKEMDWMNELAPTPVSGGYKASFLSYLGSVEQFGCLMPAANAVIRDLSDRLAGD
jgi:hypothetical protein